MIQEQHRHYLQATQRKERLPSHVELAISLLSSLLSLGSNSAAIDATLANALRQQQVEMLLRHLNQQPPLALFGAPSQCFASLLAVIRSALGTASARRASRELLVALAVGTSISRVPALSLSPSPG